jgi:hypothetical protein
LHNGWKLRRRVALIAAATIGTIGIPLVATSAAGAQDGASRHGSNLSRRLEALADEARATTSDAGQNRIAGLPDEGPGSLLRGAGGDLHVNARLTVVDPATEAALARAGAVVVARSVVDHLVTIAVDPAELEGVAAVAGVEWVEEVLRPMVHRTDPQELQAALEDAGVVTNGLCVDRITSEADTQLGAASARSTYGVNGAGIKVGVISDSYNRLNGAAADIADGELPGPGNPCGFTTPVEVQSEYSGTGFIDEGRAMAQAVHDLAPGASIRVATAFVSDVDFANQIRGLAAAGAKVIVDDITYFNEPIYQDGVIARAVNDVTALGVTYFSSAGNFNARIGSNDVGSYEAQAYRPSASCPSTIVADFEETSCHDFDPGAGVDTTSTYTVANGGTLRFKLGWSQPAFGITTDLDLFLVDTATNTVVAAGFEDNINDTDAAYELMTYTNSSGGTRTYALAVGRYVGSASPRFKVILLDDSGLTGVERSTASGTDVIGPTSFGHNMTPNGASIAAIEYSATSAPETYSSRGPATYCWNQVNGTTPASAKSCVTDNLDVTATDGGANSFFGALVSGVYRFYGTSQAAPHAAAVAALQLQSRPCRTPAQVLAAQRASGSAIGAFGVNAIGSGKLNAPAAISNLAGCPPNAPTGVTGTPGNGQVSLSWTAPASNGGSAITGYTVTPFIGASAQSARVFNSAATSQTITGLANGTAYTFKVAATSANGTGTASASSAAITPRTFPGAPTGVAATALNRSASVTWTAPASNGGSAITGYTVTPYIGAVAQAPTVLNTAGTSATVTGLTAGTSYTFKVVARNVAGSSPQSGSSNAVTPLDGDPWAPFASWGAMVDRFYLDLLGRGPSSSERSTRISQLTSGSLTPGGLVAVLRSDVDQTTNVDPMTRLYRAYFLRIPDRGGLTFWIRQRRVNGRNLNSISSTFAASSEFKTKYGSLTNRQFVEFIYEDVLGRAGDTSGVNFWTSRLDRKVNTRGQVMVGFSESSEFKNKQASEVTVSVIYILLAGRAPTTTEFADLVARLDAGTTTPAAIAQEIINSPAYATRIGG